MPAKGSTIHMLESSCSDSISTRNDRSLMTLWCTTMESHQMTVIVTLRITLPACEHVAAAKIAKTTQVHQAAQAVPVCPQTLGEKQKVGTEQQICSA